MPSATLSSKFGISDCEIILVKSKSVAADNKAETVFKKCGVERRDKKVYNIIGDF